MPLYIMFSITSLLFAIPMLVLYLYKKPIASFRNRLYLFLIVLNILGLLSEVGAVFLSKDFLENQFIMILFDKLVIAYFLTWGIWYFIYLLNLCFKEWKKTYTYIAMIIYFVLLVIGLFLPYSVHQNVNGITDYTYGTAIQYLYTLALIEIVAGIILIIVRHKYIKTSEYIPFIVFVVLITISSIVQYIFPELLLTSSVQTFVLTLMMHTIENPDIKLIQQLQLARQEIERSNTAKSDFLSGMSHDIRTPLNAIVGFSEYIGETDDIEEARENANDIVHASHTLLDIINGILDVSKIESGKIDIIENSYETLDNFEELAKLIEPRMKEKGLDFSYSISPNVPKYLYGDISNIKKVVTNLLSNASKYTEKGFVNYTVDASTEDDLCKLFITVEDSGQGVKKEELDEIFEKYSRLDVEKNNSVEGTGLGLALSKEIMELMGGTIKLDSNYGVGSKFQVEVTQKIVDGSDVKTISYENYDNVNLSGKKILIVDDSSLNLRVERIMLEEFNADNITICNSGFECMKKITMGDEYDIILMDDIMPKLNGLETCKRLKDIAGFNIPIVVVTANAITGMRERYLKEGFDEYLAKPLEKKEMVRIFSLFLKDAVKDEDNNIKQYKLVNGEFKEIA